MTVEGVLFLGFIFTVAVVLYGFALYVKASGISFLFSVLSSICFVALAVEVSDKPMLMIVFIGIVVFQSITTFLLFKREADL